MDALRGIFVDLPDEVLVDILRHKRNHRSGRLAYGHKCGIERHICINLILLHPFCPETLAASSYIPVAHIVHKILERSCDFRNPVICQIVVHFFYKRVQLERRYLSITGSLSYSSLYSVASKLSIFAYNTKNA